MAPEAPHVIAGLDLSGIWVGLDIGAAPYSVGSFVSAGSLCGSRAYSDGYSGSTTGRLLVLMRFESSSSKRSADSLWSAAVMDRGQKTNDLLIIDAQVPQVDGEAV